MSLTLALNFAWGFIALAAVLWFALAERSHSCVRQRGSGMQRVAAVLLAVCLLFPCVSASDDILGLAALRGGTERAPAPEKNSVHLERVLQELENLQVSAAFLFIFVLYCLGIVEISQTRNRAHQRPCVIGRGPPVAV